MDVEYCNTTSKRQLTRDMNIRIIHIHMTPIFLSEP
jgi:hypothetical protein